jgi:hypothetical protein
MSIRKSIRSTAFSQGMGRHSRAEIIQLMESDLESLSTLLGQKEFLFGDKPSTIDAIMYGFLVNVLWTPREGDLKTITAKRSNLVSHCDRMHKLCFETSN